MNRRLALGASWILLGTGAALAPLGGLAVHAWVGPGATLSAALGAGLATVLALSTIWLWAWAAEKPPRFFMAALAGGFLGRMVVFGAAIVLLLVATELPPAAFMGGLFVYYVIFQVLEIRALRRFGGATGSQASVR